jgi:hypothetical protein
MAAAAIFNINELVKIGRLLCDFDVIWYTYQEKHAKLKKHAIESVRSFSKMTAAAILKSIGTV